MKFSIIVCIYNAAPLVRQCLEALLKCTTEDPSTWELILVDNHGPDDQAKAFIYDLRRDSGGKKIWCVDPGRNLGCHEGWNFAFYKSEGDFVVKLDDDTIIQTDGWLTKMADALEEIPSLAYVSADIDAKQANKYELRDFGGIKLEVPSNPNAVVGFSCVMFRRSDILAWGPMKSKYRAAGGKTVESERLYGGEEAHYAQHAHRQGRMIAHFPAVFCHHLDNEERHPDYAAWKRAYGFHAWTDKDMEAWIADGEHIASYCKFILIEIKQAAPNDVLLQEWVRRLGQIASDKTCLDVISMVPKKTINANVISACIDATTAIEGRIK